MFFLTVLWYYNSMKKIVIGILIVFLIIVGIFTFKFFTTEAYITSDEAKQIAMNDVANKTGEYTFNSVEFNENNGNYIYTLDINDIKNNYIYKINAKSKKIISSKKESLTNNKIYINEEEILNIIYKNANLNKKDCNLISNLVVLEGNIPIYNTVFYYNNIKYEYKTNAYTGAIISVTKLNENAV